MTPAARIQAAIDLLAQIEAMQRPAEQVAGDFVRARRYMGSKDRRAVQDLAFAVLRGQARLDWWAGQDGQSGGGARARVLLALLLSGQETVASIARLCDGGGYHPGPLEPGERAMLETAAEGRLSDPRQPEAVRLELPEWLLPEFARAFGDDIEAELRALDAPAPLDLRVNPLLAESVDSVRAALAADGVETEPTPYAPQGLRVTGRRNVTATAPFREGHVEVQDEGSQIVGLLADARPGLAVCDFCAGAGGKTLALAAAMTDRGRLVALDVDGERLGRAGPRLSRAGARNVERRLLAGDGDPWLDEQAGAFDRVLVDAPCSGVGAWRRQPDARWRLSEAALRRHQESQARILAQAGRLVKPGGRLIYATCSLLPGENRDRVAEFRAAQPAFVPLPVEGVWAETAGTAPPGTGPPGTGPELTLTPARHGTDGFYVAVLERQGER